MLKGFKDFIMRGNVVELAIAVVIGSAFAAVISAVVTGFIKPLIAAAPSTSSSGYGFYIRTDGNYKAKTFVDISSIINAIIVFLITAAVVYFVVVLPLQKMAELRARRLAAGQEPEMLSAPSDEIVLLTEIRDLLRSQAPGISGAPTGLVPPTV